MIYAWLTLQLQLLQAYTIYLSQHSFLGHNSLWSESWIALYTI